MKNNRQLLLLVLVFLIALRFVIVPVFEWQNEKLADIESDKIQYMKAQSVIQRLPEINASLIALQAANNKLQSNYYNNPSIDGVKLKRQQQIQALFKQYNVKVKNFNWIAELPNPIMEIRAAISFEGKTKDIALLQLQIAQLDKLIHVEQWSLRMRKMTKQSLGQTTGRLTLVLYNVSPSEQS